MAGHHFNLAHPGEGRAAPAPRNQEIHRFLRALGLEFHAAITPVAHPAIDSQAQALGAGTVTVTHALDTTFDLKLDPLHGEIRRSFKRCRYPGLATAIAASQASMEIVESPLESED